MAGAVWAALRLDSKAIRDRDAGKKEPEPSLQSKVSPASAFTGESSYSSSLAEKKRIAASQASRDLYDAAWIGDFEGAFNALEAGADQCRTFGARKISTLHVAARTGNVPICQMLLAREDRQVDIRNKDGETP
eukprot:CAMPEP_0178449738 /NCGR_PEP_ID=MMETSP0689_2-20121128/42731_1 /TAXON_ID=160604 /ORGANISM="Amphidinium massartii, Strain CS-259" /LENGTH=132 /DNA_ID=CAMNT_0020075117 /DNA_START=34 /DNA_END=429 /DNA_ORIENTATION=+